MSIAVVVTIAIFLFGLNGTLVAFLIKLEARLTALEIGAAPFQKALEKMAIDILHHPTEPERDALLERFHSLTRDEAKELKRLLLLVIEDKRSTRAEATSAYLLIASLNARFRL